jgi:hypothetical protein
MNRKITSDIFTGAEIPYGGYRLLLSEFAEPKLSSYFAGVRQSFRSILVDWSNDKNSEWATRHYLAVKMVLASSVLLTSLEYAEEHNLRIVEPYLAYYSLFNCSRAVVFTYPEQAWKGGELIKIPHYKALHVAQQSLTTLDTTTGTKIKSLLDNAKNQRELFSYRFPALKPKGHNIPTIELAEVIRACTLLAELAQAHSECFDHELREYLRVHPEFDSSLSGDALEQAVIARIGDNEFYDEEDAYRVGYMIRKIHRPFNLYMMMTEGLVEDYFGAWCSDRPTTDEDHYDPDENWRIIFDVP